VLAYLADDTRATHPTLAAAAALFGWGDAVPAPLTGLLRWRLAHPLAGEPLPQSSVAWQADPALVLSIQNEGWVDPALDRCARFTSPEEAVGLPCIYPELHARMLAELPASTWIAGDPEFEAVLVGPQGSGRQTLAAQFAGALGLPLLAVKTPLLPITPGAVPESKIDGLIQAARLAQATGSVLYLRDAEAVSPADWLDLRRLGCRMLRGISAAPARATHSYALAPLPTSRRLEIWEYASDQPAPPSVRTQRLTPAEIRLLASSERGEAANISLRQAMQTHSELMQSLPCPYTWDDLVVSPNLLRTLKDFEAQVLLRWEVYEKWGFSRLTHLGQGISALFGGPSGTGKTMAAQVLARSLGLELYRVDLAGVVNKYIGETEKRLRDVFDACERSGALLFFDEADALFGNRMQVKDSHDRFANIEIDYLLQRIEQFDGIAILATNRKNDLDAAFLRRLRFVIDFLNPDRRERRILWEKSLPALTPDGERITGELDFSQLADDLELNGAQIKAIALGAAFLARGAGTRIGMEHIELAAHREYAKQGQMLRAALGKGALL
jgi:SpoVK/Ycf46/Vps4 family AAA+-type ATPase